MLIAEPAAEPITDREGDEHDRDRVRPDDRRRPEVRGHQPSRCDLGTQARHPDHEDEQEEEPLVAAQLDPLIRSSRWAPCPAAAARAARASLNGTPRCSARSRRRWRSVSCFAQSRKSQASTPRVTKPPSTIMITPAMLWSVTAEMCHFASPDA